MFEEGDIVRYIGAERAIPLGHRLLTVWHPYHIPSMVRIVLSTSNVLINRLKTGTTVTSYQIRVFGIMDCSVHKQQTFYDFELEKIEY
jgi:hypothetical protein